MRGAGCLVAVLLLSLGTQSTAHETTGRNKSGAVVKRQDKPRNVAFRFRSAFLVTTLRLHANVPVRRVRRTPTIERGDPGDHMRCKRAGSQLELACRGEIGQGVRMLGAFKID